eukprot:6156652-Prymnesium_polylepis.1
MGRLYQPRPLVCPGRVPLVDRCLKPLHHQKSVPSSAKLLLAHGRCALLPALISSSSESPAFRPAAAFQLDWRPRPAMAALASTFHPGRGAAR